MRTRHVVAASVTAAALLLGAIGGGLLYAKKKEDDRQALKDEKIAERKAMEAQLIAQMNEQRELIVAAEAELASAQTDEERTRARAKLEAAREQQRRIYRPVAVGIPIKRDPSSAPCKCLPGDPLCSCL